jgi:hypothetical protein
MVAPPEPKTGITPPPNPFGSVAPKSDGPFISFPLSGGNVVEIRLKQKVSFEDFKRLKSLIDLSEGSLVGTDDVG